MYAQVVLNTPVKQQFTYEYPEEMDVRIGMRALVPFGRREMTAYVVGTTNVLSSDSYTVKPLKRMIDKEPLYGEAEVNLALWMSRFYLCSQGEALSTMIPGGRRDVGLPPFDLEDEDVFVSEGQLSDEQKGAIDSILTKSKPMHYLYGVTGSGKSEVFLRVAEAVIAQGLQVIYLVPEITLTHQLSRQVMNRFSNKVAILHSALSPSQRLAQWRRIKRGEVSLAIGARSAVFAPFEHLGLIIIDEEHENSYKSGSSPRYHARQIAQKRVSDTQALLMMGSATPSLEAWQMMEEGNVQRHILSQRVAGGVPPVISVVNMLGEERTLSRKLVAEMKKVLERKKQVILFLNRRGFSYFFHCQSCGYEMSCPHCSVSLTYHKETDGMVCHYCGYRRRPVSVCPECRSVDVGYSGFGTEMVEQEVRTFFPQARISRLDTDSAKEKPLVAQILNDFRQGDIDILLGTQMVAKGLNFPLVELVGIVLADSGLNLPDFRSQERAFSLIVQVSGRAGRFNDRGKVVVQTYRPDNTAIRLACTGAFAEFYRQELEARRETDFPPFSRMVNLVLRGRNKDKVRAETQRLATMTAELVESMKAVVASEEELPNILGYAECPLERIAGNWRHHVVIRGKQVSRVIQIVTLLNDRYKAPSGVYLEIDVDPLQLL
jgi:primosomal protein N' (replication factor Y) (superfamily II helicase)